MFGSFSTLNGVFDDLGEHRIKYFFPHESGKRTYLFTSPTLSKQTRKVRYFTISGSRDKINNVTLF